MAAGVLAFLAAGVLGGCVVNGSGRIAVQDEKVRFEVGFNEHEWRYIREYYKAHPPKGLSPGLVKKGKLPPGIAKQLARGDRLPERVEGERLPGELERRLRTLPDGIGGDVVLVEGRTRAILDSVSATASF